MDAVPFWVKVLRQCEARPAHDALINSATGEKATYGDLGRHVAFAREKFQDSGVTRGSRIILAADRTFAFVYAYLAVHSLGAVAIPFDPRAPKAAISRIIELVQPALVIWPNGVLPGSMSLSELDATSDRPVPDGVTEPFALADIMFTSGTTGEPKGVLLGQDNLSCAINNINKYIGNTPEDIELCPMPLSHSFGIARIRCNLYLGATIVLEDGIANPRHLFGAMEKFNVTGLSMVGPAWAMLRRLSGDRLKNFRGQLRYFELGSAVMEPKAKAYLAALLPDTHVCMHYGLTEASRAAFLDFHDEEPNLESVGKASPYCEIGIFSSDGSRLASGAQGEVCVAGGMVCKGYLNSAHNQDAWHGNFFRTGDVGWLDAKGYLHLVGRLKEMISVGGEKVAPAEVEKLLNTLPGIEESACVGLPHPILGEQVAAFIVSRDDARPDPDSIRAFLRERLEPYKVPTNFIFIKELPRTVSGKVKRLELKEMANG